MRVATGPRGASQKNLLPPDRPNRQLSRPYSPHNSGRGPPEWERFYYPTRSYELAGSPPLGDAVVLLGCLVRVPPRGWDPPGHPVDHHAAPPGFLELAVVVAAHQGEVVDVGRAVEPPGYDVVSLTPFRRVLAAGEGAAFVPGGC